MKRKDICDVFKLKKPFDLLIYTQIFKRTD